MGLNEGSIMKNEEVNQRFDRLENSIHHERREDRDSLDKLTDAVTTLTISMAESRVSKEAVERRLEIVEKESKQTISSVSDLNNKVSGLEPVIKSNAKGKEDQTAFYFRILEKVALFGILGGIAYKINGG